MSNDTGSVDKKVVETERGFEQVLHSQRGTGVRDQDEVTTTLTLPHKPKDSTVHELLTRHQYALETVRQYNPDQDNANE